MGKVIGLGGIFFLCKDVEATRGWYTRTLGIEMNDFGGAMFLHADSARHFPKGAMTIWSPFQGDSDYFKPSASDFMMNLMVDSLDEVVAKLEAEGVPLEGERMDEPYGRFAWVMDPDGRKIELWEPAEPTEDAPA
ncbi:MAG: VOC family protein [Pseudomonadota bacterium]